MTAWETLQHLDQDDLIAAFNEDCKGRGLTSSVYLDELRHREIIGSLEEIDDVLRSIDVNGAVKSIVDVLQTLEFSDDNREIVFLLKKIEGHLARS